MKKFKLGFTLAEVLLVCAILGFVVAVSLNTVKFVNAYTNLAYFAHKNIVDIVGTLYAGDMTMAIKKEKDRSDESEQHFYAKGKEYTQTYYVADKLTKDALYYSGYTNENGEALALPSMVTHCKDESGKIYNVLKNDNEWYSSITNCNERTLTPISADKTNLFCKSFAALTNISGKYSCDTLFDPAPAEQSKGGPYIAHFDETILYSGIEPNFILTNGMAYFISKWDKNDNISTKYGYRLIAVDLNGKSKPNKRYKHHEDDILNKFAPPDIVTFLVLDNGEVYPLELAADNYRIDNRHYISYINSKVNGYHFTDSKDRTNVPPECDSWEKDGSGNWHVTHNAKCNYGKVPLQNPNSAFNSQLKTPSTNFTYRQALCFAKRNHGLNYADYCNYKDGNEFKTIEQSDKCPPFLQHVNEEQDDYNERIVRGFDACLVAPVKPAFRFGF